MERLRLVFFNRSYPPEASATAQLLSELCEDLAREHGCEVTVVAGPPLGAVTPEVPAETSAVRVLRVSGTTFAKGNAIGRVINYLSYFAAALVRGLSLRRRHVFVAMTDPPIVGLAALCAARLSGARFVMLFQDVFPEVGRLLRDLRSPMVDAVLERTNRFLLYHADGVIAIGERMAQRLEDKGAAPGAVWVIHNWVDCTLIVPVLRENVFSQDHDLQSRFVVMYSGNLGLSQNLDNTILAAACLRDNTDILFVFVGEGVRKTELQQLAGRLSLDNVRFIGFQSRAGLALSLGSADLHVVSLQAGLAGYLVPSKLYGVLAAGRPVLAVVDDDCEVAEIARRWDCGVVADPSRPEDIAAKILDLATDPQRCARLGENARRAALEFDKPGQVRRYYDALSSVSRSIR